jgi:hypothetical protein
MCFLQGKKQHTHTQKITSVGEDMEKLAKQMQKKSLVVPQKDKHRILILI